MRQPLTPQQRSYLNAIRGGQDRHAPVAQLPRTRATWWQRLLSTLRRSWSLRSFLPVFLAVVVPLTSGQQLESDDTTNPGPSSIARERVETRLDDSSECPAAWVADLLQVVDETIRAVRNSRMMNGQVDDMKTGQAERTQPLDCRNEQPVPSSRPLGEGGNLGVEPRIRPPDGPHVDWWRNQDWAVVAMGVTACVASIVIILWLARCVAAAPRSKVEDGPVPERNRDIPAVSPHPGGSRPPDSIVPQAKAACDSPQSHTRQVLDARLWKACFGITLPCDNRFLGWATHQGGRDENQDRVIAFETSGWLCALAADGMGGEPFGGQSAGWAITGSARGLIRVLAGAVCQKLDPGTVAAIALSEAQREITKVLTRKRRSGVSTGYRSTLIVATCHDDVMGYAYLGDGGGYILRRTTGELQRFLTPMKLTPGSNVITGSLGPTVHGEPECGSVQVQPGDLVLLGTDGLFDHVRPQDLARGLGQAIEEFGGNIHRAARVIVQELAAQRDRDGWIICDDNLTLAAILVPGKDVSAKALATNCGMAE